MSYTVLRRDDNSRNVVTDQYEILSTGGEGLDLHDALVEANARNLLLDEGEWSTRWTVEPPVGFVGESVGADEVYEFLVENLDVPPGEAARLVE